MKLKEKIISWLNKGGKELDLYKFNECGLDDYIEYFDQTYRTVAGDYKERIDGICSNILVFIDGVYNSEKSVFNNDIGITETGLDYVFDGNLLDNINREFFTSKLEIEVKGDLHIINIFTQKGAISQLRNCYKIDSNANIYETFMVKDTCFINNFNRFKVNSNIRFNYFPLHLKDTQGKEFITNKIIQKKESICNIYGINTECDLLRNNYIVELQKGSTNNVNILSLLSGNKRVDINVTMNHISSYTNSDIKVKGFLNDQSMHSFVSNVYIKRNIKKVVASKLNKNLVLSEDVKIVSEPNFEIYSSDVKCFHGASSGHIDEEALIYLMSRGISKNKATTLLYHSFVNDMITKDISSLVNPVIDNIISNV